MQVNSNQLVAGVDAPECDTQAFCSYGANIVARGTDIDDDIILIQSIYTSATQKVDLPTPTNAVDYIALEAELNKLNLGKFKVSPTGDQRTKIISENNAMALHGIGYTHESLEKFLPFYEYDCSESQPCDGYERCNYSLHRKFETSNNDDIKFVGINFENDGYRTSPIDTRNVKEIEAFVNSQIESEGKFKVFYTNNTIHFGVSKTKYKPKDILFEIITINPDGTPKGESSKTDFEEGECIENCCGFVCGGEGQVPCPNGEENGCNNDLQPDLDGICRKKCQSGTVYFGGEWIQAGNLGQLADCNNECNGNLVATNHGCVEPHKSVTVGDIDLVVKVNPAEKIVSMHVGELGTFMPPTNPILFGDGSSILEWLNDPVTGICPNTGTDCFDIEVNEISDSDLDEYRFKLTDVSIDFTNVKEPIQTTVQFCEAEKYHSCVEPSDFEEKDVDTDCPVGQVFNTHFCKCENVDLSDVSDTEALIHAGLCYPCAAQPEHIVNDTDYQNNRASKITAKIGAIKNDAAYNQAVIDYFKARGGSPDYQAVAISRLIIEGLLPDWERLCANGEPVAI